MDVSVYLIVLLIAVLLMIGFNCCPIACRYPIFLLSKSRLRLLSNCFIIDQILHLHWWPNHLLWMLYLAFLVIVMVCTAIILCLSPEMKGKTFVQIQKEVKDWNDPRIDVSIHSCLKKKILYWISSEHIAPVNCTS